MSDPAQREGFRRIAAKVGVGVSAFTVFTAGWIAMRSDDWRTILGVSALALLAGIIAAGLSRQGR
jgi:apolipoprotein N-acyltransferase